MIGRIALCACTLLFAVSVASSQKVAGVWRLDEIRSSGPNGRAFKITQPSMYIFTKGHYSIVRIDATEPRSTVDPKKMTAAELLETFVASFIAQAGTYEIKAGTMTMRPTVAKSPTTMLGDKWTAFTVKIKGKTMILTNAGYQDDPKPAANPQTFSLMRVE